MRIQPQFRNSHDTHKSYSIIGGLLRRQAVREANWIEPPAVSESTDLELKPGGYYRQIPGAGAICTRPLAQGLPKGVMYFRAAGALIKNGLMSLFKPQRARYSAGVEHFGIRRTVREMFP